MLTCPPTGETGTFTDFWINASGTREVAQTLVTFVMLNVPKVYVPETRPRSCCAASRFVALPSPMLSRASQMPLRLPRSNAFEHARTLLKSSQPRPRRQPIVTRFVQDYVTVAAGWYGVCSATSLLTIWIAGENGVDTTKIAKDYGIDAYFRIRESVDDQFFISYTIHDMLTPQRALFACATLPLVFGVISRFKLRMPRDSTGKLIR